MERSSARRIKFHDVENEAELTEISEASTVNEGYTASAPRNLVTTVVERMQEAESDSTATSSSSSSSSSTSFQWNFEPFLDPRGIYDIEKLLELLNMGPSAEILLAEEIIIEEKERLLIDFDYDELEVESTESERSLRASHSSWEPEIEMGEEEDQSIDHADTSSEAESYDAEWEAYVSKVTKERHSEIRKSETSVFDREFMHSFKKEGVEASEAVGMVPIASSIDAKVQANVDATNIINDFLNDLIRIVCHSSDTLKELDQIGRLLDKPKMFIELYKKAKFLHELQITLIKLNHLVAEFYRGKMKMQVFSSENHEEQEIYYARLLENMKSLDRLLYKRYKLQTVLPSKYQHLEKEKKQREDALKLQRDELYNMIHRLLKTKKRSLIKQNVEAFIKKMEKMNNEVSSMRKIFIEKQDTLGNYENKMKNIKNIEGLDIDRYTDVKFIVNSLQKRNNEREDAIVKSIYEYNCNLNIMAHVDEYIEVLRAKTKVLKESEAFLLPIINELRPILGKSRAIATKIRRSRVRYFSDNIFNDPNHHKHYAEIDLKVRNLIESNKALRKELANLHSLYKKLEIKCKKKENV